MNKLTKLSKIIYEEQGLLTKGDFKDLGKKIIDTHKVLFEYSPLINSVFKTNVEDYFERQEPHPFVNNVFGWAENTLLYSCTSRDLSPKQAAAISSAVCDVFSCMSTPIGRVEDKSNKYSALWSQFNAENYLALFSGLEDLIFTKSGLRDNSPYFNFHWVDPRDGEATNVYQKYFNQKFDIVYNEMNESYNKINDFIFDVFPNNNLIKREIKRKKIMNKLIQKRRKDLGIYVKKPFLSSLIEKINLEKTR